ncbi:MAG: TlpA family protein disulfide reductase [Bacteroidetes bacterium]|nr:TlpA family protein disulfide reductase [Bacteroidota bacterium]
MNKVLAFILIYATLISSCNYNKNANTTTIEVFFQKQYADKLNGKYIYLFGNGHKLLDSAIVQKETAVFKLNSHVQFVIIKRKDTFNNVSYLRPFDFANPFIKNTYESFFYIEKGTTKIWVSSIDDTTAISAFKGSKQNTPYFKQIFLKYPDNNSNQKESKQIIANNIELIKQYPYAVFFLEQLYMYREKFTNETLKEQLSYFNNDAKETSLYKQFDNYFLISATYDKAYPENIQLIDTANIFHKIGNDKSNYNLIVFWASWCGPCRREIPELKDLYNLYKDKGLCITSISIDGGTKEWKVALLEEKMTWQQLIAIDSTRTLIDLHYNIKAIPRAYLFDKHKQLVEVFEGSNSKLKNTIIQLFKK